MIAFCQQNISNDLNLVKSLYENILENEIECGASNNLASMYHRGTGKEQKKEEEKIIFFQKTRCNSK